MVCPTSRERRALTVLEALVVVLIVMVLVALFAPLIAHSKKSAQISASLGRLRQLHAAVLLYQSDAGLDGPSADALPPYAYVYGTFLGLGERFFVSPCGYKPEIEGNGRHLSYQYWNAGLGAPGYFREFGENAVIFNDSHCNSAAEWHALFRSKRGLAVAYSGRLINLYKVGDPGRPRWWTSPLE